MCPEDRLGDDNSIPVKWVQSDLPLNFFQFYEKSVFQKIVEIFSFSEFFLNMFIRFSMKDCP